MQEVWPDTPAAETGIQPGDVIVSADSRDVSQPADVAQAWLQARKAKKPVLLRILRNGQPLFLAIAAG